MPENTAAPPQAVRFDRLKVGGQFSFAIGGPIRTKSSRTRYMNFSGGSAHTCEPGTYVFPAPNPRAIRTKPAPRTGRVSVYVMYNDGGDATLRPAHDTPPSAGGKLTEQQERTLRDKIGRYVSECHRKNQARAQRPV